MCRNVLDIQCCNYVTVTGQNWQILRFKDFVLFRPYSNWMSYGKFHLVHTWSNLERFYFQPPSFPFPFPLFPSCLSLSPSLFFGLSKWYEFEWKFNLWINGLWKIRNRVFVYFNCNTLRFEYRGNQRDVVISEHLSGDLGHSSTWVIPKECVVNPPSCT